MNKNEDIINLRPSASSISTYVNMAYDHWGALGEFVDNSVQSYIKHKRAIQKNQNREKLKVEINTSTLKIMLLVLLMTKLLGLLKLVRLLMIEKV